MVNTIILILFGLGCFVLGLWFGEEVKEERQKTKREYTIYSNARRR